MVNGTAKAAVTPIYATGTAVEQPFLNPSPNMSRDLIKALLRP